MSYTPFLNLIKTCAFTYLQVRPSKREIYHLLGFACSMRENKPTTSTTFWYLSFHPQSPRSLRHLAPIGASQGICHFTCSSLSIDAVLRQATLRGARGVVRLMPCSAQAVHRDVAWRQKGPWTRMNGDLAIKFIYGVFGWLGILRVSTPSMPTDKALWEWIIHHHDPWTGGVVALAGVGGTLRCPQQNSRQNFWWGMLKVEPSKIIHLRKSRRNSLKEGWLRV